MPLFRRENKPLKFDIVGLSDEEMKEITGLVLRNGGKVEHNDVQPIKFTKPFQFVETAFPGARLYDIEFIKDCIAKKKIVDAMPYRIGKPFLYDDCMMAHFLGAKSDCCMSNLCTEQAEGNAQNDQSPISKVTGSELPKPHLQNVSTVERAADSVRDHPRQVQVRSVTQINDNAENLSKQKLAATRPNPASDRDPESKTELSGPTNRKLQSGNNGNTSIESHAERVRRLENQLIRSRKRGRGAAITTSEEKSILKYLTDNNVILESAVGLQVWEEMIKSGICTHRAANSLYSHFRKTMVPNIERYTSLLTEKQLKKFNKIKET